MGLGDMNSDEIVKTNHQIEVAGKLWTFPEVRYVRDHTGALGVSISDLMRYQEAVTIHVCTSDGELTVSEFELVCSVAGMKTADLATEMRMDRSTISKWRNLKSGEDPRKKTIAYVYSIVVKSIILKKLMSSIERRDEEVEKQRRWILKMKNLPQIKVA